MTRAALLCAVWLGGCAAVGPAAQTALQALAPIAVEALGEEVRRRYGPAAAVDPSTAACFSVDDDEYVHIECVAKMAE